METLHAITTKLTFEEFITKLKEQDLHSIALYLQDFESSVDVKDSPHIGAKLDELQNLLLHIVEREDIVQLGRYAPDYIIQTTITISLSADCAFGFHIDRNMDYERSADGDWRYYLFFALITSTGILETMSSIDWYD